MERSSDFIENKAIFGSYPAQSDIDYFESIGVRYYIDLTFENESKIVPYVTKYNYIRYPIEDRKIPSNLKSFTIFIIKLCSIISNLENQKIYVHCKGGHGRSGIVVACILSYMYKISPVEAIEKTNFFHNNRKEMKDKWRKIGSPQNYLQKQFVLNLFNPIFIDKTAIYDCINHRFNYYSNYRFKKDKITTCVSYADYLKYIYEENNENICNKLRTHFNDFFIYKLIKRRTSEYGYVKNFILHTYLRPIVVNDEIGNVFGNILSELREELYQAIT